MFEIPLKTVDRLHSVSMQLESITYLEQLLFEDNDGWVRHDDPECFLKDHAANLLFNLQRDAVKELHDILFDAPFL